MNCNCIEQIQKLLEERKDKKGRKVTKASLRDYSIQIDPPKLEVVSFSIFELTIEGLVMKKEERVYHSFCPYCGKESEISKHSQKKHGTRSNSLSE